jgi:hypothetical protein
MDDPESLEFEVRNHSHDRDTAFGIRRGHRSARGVLAGRPVHRGGSFSRGLLVETSGPRSEVVRTMPAMTTSPEDLHRGLEILAHAASTGRESP